MMSLPCQAGSCWPFSMGSIFDLGYMPAGRMLRVDAHASGGVWVVEWEAEGNPWLGNNDWAVYLFVDGKYQGKYVTEDSAVISVPSSRRRIYVDVLVLPNRETYEDWPYAYDVPNLVRLAWLMGGYAERIEIYASTTTPVSTTGTPVATLTAITPSCDNPVGPWSGGHIYVSGGWSDSKVKYAEIPLEITYTQMVPLATFKVTYDGITRHFTTSAEPQEILNGIKVAFEEGVTFEEGETFTIRVGLPQSYVHGRLTGIDGAPYYYKLAAVNAAGAKVYSSEASAPIYDDPEPPSYIGKVYDRDTRTVTVTMRPGSADADVEKYYVYRSFDYLGSDETHWFPVVSGAASAGTNFSFDVGGLVTGLNRIEVKVGDTYGLRSPGTLVDVVVDADGYLAEEPNPPSSMQAVVTSSGHLVVTVWADSSSETLEIYGDDHTGTIDYNTAIAEIENPQVGTNQKLQVTITSGLTDGIYRLGARAVNGNYREENTTITATVNRVTVAATTPTGLAAQTVWGGDA